MYSKDIRDCVLRKRNDLNQSIGKIAKDLNMSKSSVQYIIHPKEKKCKKRGRKAKISERSKRKIIRTIKKSFKTGEKITASNVINETGLKVHIRTMHRTLNNIACSWKPYKKSIELLQTHKDQRVSICKQWLKEQVNFQNIVFSDEVRFNLNGPDSMMTWVYGKERPTRITRCMGGGSLLLSGILFNDGELFLYFLDQTVSSETYISHLDENILPCIRNKKGNDFIFQQDLAKPHTSKKTMTYLAEKNVQVLPWPSKSPDINLIEHIWGILKDRVYDGTKIFNKKQLKDRIISAIAFYDKNYKFEVRKWFNSYFDRVLKVICSNGCLLN